MMLAFELLDLRIRQTQHSMQNFLVALSEGARGHAVPKRVLRIGHPSWDTVGLGDRNT